MFRRKIGSSTFFIAGSQPEVGIRKFRINRQCRPIVIDSNGPILPVITRFGPVGSVGPLRQLRLGQVGPVD